MQSISLDTETMDWTSGIPFYGPNAVYDGKEIVRLKVLSDRRAEGGGIAWLVHFTPPEGKVIRIVAVALSDEHIFGLEGGRGTKTGEPLRSRGNYGLNPRGKVHSAYIGKETLTLVIYNGEPDEVRSMEVLDAAAA
jgi:hypothetical protein